VGAEQVVFTRVKEDSLPPKVLEADRTSDLERSARSCGHHAVKDDRGEKDSKKPQRMALMMESLDPPPPSRTASSTGWTSSPRRSDQRVYNAVEHRASIPMRYITGCRWPA